MKIFSQATQRFLEPIDPKELQDAILNVDIKHKKKDAENPYDLSRFVIDIYEEREQEGEIKRFSPYSWTAQRFVTSRFKHGFKCINKPNCFYNSYEVSATDYSVFLIDHCWTGRKVISPNALLVFNKIRIQNTQAELSAERISQLRDAINKKRTLTEVYPDFWFNPFLNILPNGHQLGEYQKVAAQNTLCAEEGYGLFLEPGLGKTIIAIQKMDEIGFLSASLNKRPARILILVPKNIRQNWLNEICEFSRLSYTADVLKGHGETERSISLINALTPNIKGIVQATIVIAGYDAAVGTPLIDTVEWDLIILDESHNIASPSTQRTKFILSLRDKAQFRLVLSGTPIRNTPFDLYTQLEFISKGLSGFDSFHAFKEFFGEWVNSKFAGFRQLEAFKNIPLLQERLAKYTFIMKKEEALPFLPKKTFDILECSLTPEQFKIYRQVATFLQGEINSIEIKDAVTVNNILTKLLRLAQITSGYAMTDESGIFRFDPNPKLELLIEELKDYLFDNPNSKVQIWCTFVENIKQISYRLNFIEKIKSVIFYGATKDEDREEAVSLFNTDPETKVFIGNATAGGVGLNLVGFDPYNPEKYKTNCDWVIYYSQNWSSVSRRQSEDRAHRHITRVPIRITDLIVPGSIDQEIRDRVNAKIQMAMNVQDLRKILSGLLTSVSVNGD